MEIQKKNKTKQHQNQAQDGRSMVEMLGVLAIIGVISLGGIAGYKMAMERYQANQIANEINLMRNDAKIKLAQGEQKLFLGEPYDKIGEELGHLSFNEKYKVDFGFNHDTEESEEEEEREKSGYFISVSGVTAGVCKPLATLLESMDETVAVVINGTKCTSELNVTLCSEVSNTLEVDFSGEKIRNSGGEGNVEDEAQGEEPACDESCQGPCNEDGTCGECPTDSTWDGEKCECSETDKYWNGEKCITCPTDTEWDEGVSECVCKDKEKHLYGGQCVVCDPTTSGIWNEETKRCECDEGKYWSSLEKKVCGKSLQ